MDMDMVVDGLVRSIIVLPTEGNIMEAIMETKAITDTTMNITVIAMITGLIKM